MSFLHLLLIAWERCESTVKWRTVSKDRVKKYAGMAWLLPALLTIAPGITKEAVGARYELILVDAVLITIFWTVCFCLITYFYVKVYNEVRKWNRTQILPEKTLHAKLETDVACTTFWLTLSAGISGILAVVVYLSVGISPFLRKSSMFQWADTVLQLNSLVNPLLYSYRNRRLRKAALEMLRCRKSQTIQPLFCSSRRIRQRRYSVA